MDPIVKISKFLSLVLRHKPEKIGIALDRSGWVGIEELLAACDRHGYSISNELLQVVVATNNKKRFSFSEDGRKIRADQGHSIEVDLGYEQIEPPELLYHGTPEHSLRSIMIYGIRKGRRHHVHLSGDIETAAKVGGRRGKPVVLAIKSREMHQDNLLFYLSKNNVWLTEHVPPKYIVPPKQL